LQPVKGIGKGAYGVVCSAKVMGTGEKVAIKKIVNAFENDIDARRALREVMLLRQLHHENIIALKDIMIPAGAKKESFKDVYFVYDLMDTDLHQIIRSKQPLSDEHFKYFLYQVRSPRLTDFMLMLSVLRDPCYFLP
jgi:mitogen-activated protein kinase 1/3